MKLNYSLDQNDFLTFQLYTAFRSPSYKKIRNHNWFIVPIIYTFIASVLFFTSPPVFSITFLILAVLWTAFYPTYIRKKHAKVYRGYNEEHFKKRFDKPVEVAFLKDYVAMKDYAGEGKIKISEIESMYEIQGYYFLKFTTGIFLIIPKIKISKPKEVKTYLEKLVKKLGIPYNIDLEWR